jgi:hypothetical protein
MKSSTCINCLLGAVALVAATCGYSQEKLDSLKTLQSSAPKVFIDCDYCDLDFIRTEMAFVNYVRERKEAQVHALITTQETGSGGTEFTMTLIGQQKFEGMADTLKFVSKQTDKVLVTIGLQAFRDRGIHQRIITLNQLLIRKPELSTIYFPIPNRPGDSSAPFTKLATSFSITTRKRFMKKTPKRC